MSFKDSKELAKKAAEAIAEYGPLYEKIAQAPEWLKSYMAEQYPQGAGRPAESVPALNNGQMMYVAPDASNLQGIAMTAGANVLAEFMGAHQHNPAKAKEMAAAAHADLQVNWPKIAAAKGPGKAAVIKQAFEDVFAQYGLGAFAARDASKLNKVAQKLHSKYTK